MTEILLAGLVFGIGEIKLIDQSGICLLCMIIIILVFTANNKHYWMS